MYILYLSESVLEHYLNRAHKGEEPILLMLELHDKIKAANGQPVNLDLGDDTGGDDR